tara:strand:+ start:1938 stop:2495 length:558 start_codon:yes stop_codon:yes gene_type:complete
MIIFDDFLPDSNLRENLTKDSFWDNTESFPIKWVNFCEESSNPIEELCKLVWNKVVGIKQNIDGWEYWAHHLTADKHGKLDFHLDTDISHIVSAEKEVQMVKNGEIRTTRNGFIYYAHQTLPEGGYLEIKNKNEEIERIEPVPNRLIVFDPSKKHRVAEVKYGVRKSIVSNAWDLMPSKYRNIRK